MVVWSNLLRFSEPKIKQFSKILSKNIVCNGQVRHSSHNIFPIRATSWQWQKTKDFVNFYIMIGVIPLTLMTFFINIFVGPATLEPTPEGYEPKHWEYCRHPITRFLVRYILTPPQEDYEKQMYAYWREIRNADVRRLYQRVEDLIRERDDYQYYFYIPESAKYVYENQYIRDSNKYGVSSIGLSNTDEK